MNSFFRFSCRFSTVWYCALALMAAPGALHGQVQETPTQSEAAVVDEELLSLKKKLRSPRDTLQTFLTAIDRQDFEMARNCFDLSGLDTETAAAKLKTYAVKLNLIIDKYDPFFDLSFVSDDPKVEAPYSIIQTPELQSIQLIPDQNGLWKFSQSTVALIDTDAFDFLFAEEQQTPQDAKDAAWSFPLWLQQQFNESWWKTTFLLKDYQWVCLAVLLIAGFAIGHITKWLLNYLTRLWFHFTRADIDESPRKKLGTPVVALVHILVWYQGATLIDLPTSVMSVLLPTLKFLTVLAAVWTAFRAIDVLHNYLTNKALTTANRYDDAIVPLLTSGLKLVSIALGILLFVDVFDKDWRTVLGGFGVVGIAVAIAAKDMLGNFFGSITVLADRPFEIGDWVVIGDKVEGTVERVGIRSSRIRTFHNSEIVVPNSLLTTAIVDNMGRRNFRRFKTLLQVRYDTPVESLEAFCEGVRQLIQNSANAKENPHVYVNQFGEHSIDILVYMFFDCPDWKAELQSRHALLTDILKLASRLNVGFAFPTRTLEIETADSNVGNLVDGRSEPARENDSQN